jgi:hypothetical protein
MTAFYVGESSLLNYKMYRIIGGTFYNYPADENNKEGYIALMREKIKESFLVNQEALQSLLSSKLKLSKNTTKCINEIVLNTDFIMNDGHIEIISGDVFSTLMQYNGAFYNLATSPLYLEQNHTDFLNFLHNSFNDYARGINLLIQIYYNEIALQAKNMKIFWILGLVIFFLIYLLIYFIISNCFISSNKISSNYIDVFDGIDELIYVITAKCSDCGYFCRDECCGNRKCAEIIFTICDSTQEHKLGFITKNHRSGKRVKPDYDQLSVTFPPGISCHNKILLMCSALVLEYLYRLPEPQFVP